MATADIGCSLAEAAESEQYLQYLQEAAATPNSLHVVYINTSLRTKATAHSLVPTITCTSSNVVQTVLQGFAQVSWGPYGCGIPSCSVIKACGFMPSIGSLKAGDTLTCTPQHWVVWLCMQCIACCCDTPICNTVLVVRC